MLSISSKIFIFFFLFSSLCDAGSQINIKKTIKNKNIATTTNACEYSAFQIFCWVVFVAICIVIVIMTANKKTNISHYHYKDYEGKWHDIESYDKGGSNYTEIDGKLDSIFTPAYLKTNKI